LRSVDLPTLVRPTSTAKPDLRSDDEVTASEL
jgi:hypothetical protein